MKPTIPSADSFQAGKGFLEVGAVTRRESPVGRFGEFFAHTGRGVAFGPVPIRPQERFQLGALTCRKFVERVFDFSNRTHGGKLTAVAKWLFIEQDITYWAMSGRAMLKEGLEDKLGPLP